MAVYVPRGLRPSQNLDLLCFTAFAISHCSGRFLGPGQQRARDGGHGARPKKPNKQHRTNDERTYEHVCIIHKPPDDDDIAIARFSHYLNVLFVRPGDARFSFKTEFIIHTRAARGKPITSGTFFVFPQRSPPWFIVQVSERQIFYAAFVTAALAVGVRWKSTVVGTRTRVAWRPRGIPTRQTARWEIYYGTGIVPPLTLALLSGANARFRKYPNLSKCRILANNSERAVRPDDDYTWTSKPKRNRVDHGILSFTRTIWNSRLARYCFLPSLGISLACINVRRVEKSNGQPTEQYRRRQTSCCTIWQDE